MALVLVHRCSGNFASQSVHNLVRKKAVTVVLVSESGSKSWLGGLRKEGHVQEMTG